MAFTIPNQADASVPAQAAVDKVDIDMLVSGMLGSGVTLNVANCLVTAQSVPDMTVAVAAGTMTVYGTPDVSVSAGNVTVTTADASNPRFDLIVVDAAGAKTCVAGTPSATPVFPAIPLAKVCLAAIYVGAGVTSIVSGAIIDKRIVVGVAGSLSVNGTITLGLLLDISAAGAGQIKFPASQNASSNANTLDDYEEGTYTCTIKSETNTGSHVYSSSSGFYTKIGRLVKIDYLVAITTKDAGMSGSYALVWGQPFQKGAYGSYDAMPISFWSALPACIFITGHMQSSNIAFYVFYNNAATTGLGAALSPADIADGTTLAGSGSYHV